MKNRYVAIGLTCNAKGHYLLSQRTRQQTLAHFWEFPGGKLEANENPEQALIREWQEELGVQITKLKKFMVLSHQYDTFKVHLFVFLVEHFSGIPKSCEGQNIAWVNLHQLNQEGLLPGSRPILSALVREKELLITPEPQNSPAFLAQLELALQQGIKFVRFRQGKQSFAAYESLAHRVIPLCRRYFAPCLLDDWTLAEALSCYGWHCTSAHLINIKNNPPPKREICCSVSVHNKIELNLAKALGADFILLSPVLKTATHPEHNALGWEKFKKLCQLATMPVYALGGMNAKHLNLIEDAGGVGYAAIRGLWPFLSKETTL